MYYCSRSKNIPYSREKIIARMMELPKIIQEVAVQPYDGEIEMIGDLNLAHPVSGLIIEYRVLLYWLNNPPHPLGDKMYSRLGPYIEKAVTKDLAEALNLGEKTVERAIKKVKDELKLKHRAWVTVDEFCDMFGYPAGEVHQKLSRLLHEKWKRVKDKHKGEG